VRSLTSTAASATSPSLARLLVFRRLLPLYTDAALPPTALLFVLKAVRACVTCTVQGVGEWVSAVSQAIVAGAGTAPAPSAPKKVVINTNNNTSAPASAALAVPHTPSATTATPATPAASSESVISMAMGLLAYLTSDEFTAVKTRSGSGQPSAASATEAKSLLKVMSWCSALCKLSRSELLIKMKAGTAKYGAASWLQVCDSHNS
jgi:hypothetical protein